MKHGLENHANERDSKGRLTALALAIDALRDAECDCGRSDPPCLACMCEEALGIAVTERDDARAKLAAIANLLSDTGCDCDCGHDNESHDETCERCLGCCIEALL